MMKSIAGAGKVIKGSLTVPGDKSISHRAVMFSALAKGETKVKGFLPGEDCLSTISVFRKMGVSIEQEQDSLRIQGSGQSLILREFRHHHATDGRNLSRAKLFLLLNGG